MLAREIVAVTDMNKYQLVFVKLLVLNKLPSVRPSFMKYCVTFRTFDVYNQRKNLPRRGCFMGRY